MGRNVLEKPFAEGLSYVQSSDRASFCFTGHYGKVIHKSSGSLLHLAGTALDRKNVAGAFGNVRFFSPREILNIFGFPRDFLLPLEMPLKHRYKVVGNSIAVTVTSALLRWLLLGEGGTRLASLEQDPPRHCSQVASDVLNLNADQGEAFTGEDVCDREDKVRGLAQAPRSNCSNGRVAPVLLKPRLMNVGLVTAACTVVALLGWRRQVLTKAAFFCAGIVLLLLVEQL